MNPSVASLVPTIEHFIQPLRKAEQEICTIISLNAKFEIIAHSQYSSSHSAKVLINVRQILHENVITDCSWLVLLHNHPSGITYPSSSDYVATKKLIILGEVLYFAVLDHLIITKNALYSFAENGELKSLKSRALKEMSKL